MPAVEAGIELAGYRELMRDFARVDRDSQRFIRVAFAEAAEPVRVDAESLSLSQIPRMPLSPEWAQMRVGVTSTLVYVAPKKRGVKSRNPYDPRRRPNLADLMMERAMRPALEQNEPRIERTVEHALDRIADEFNH
jgi:hypothetical protein